MDESTEQFTAIRERRSLQGANERPQAVPYDLHADTDQQEGRETKGDAHTTFANDRGEAIGESIAEKNGSGDDRSAHNGGEDEKEVGDPALLVGAESDSD